MKLEILITLLSLIVAPTAHAIGSRPVAAGLVLMVVPPWADAAAVAAHAGAQLVGPTSAPFGTFVSVDGTAQLDALEAAGAWFLIDGDTARWICGA
ncbi:hypothetical protein V8J36_07650 [Frigidibacter sp. MR17.14]|uniref:hypothetical protein n=1 Tax=Frigidibacter sp. MR17.14 TaxID=3126509 RepID=UPI003012D130